MKQYFIGLDYYNKQTGKLTGSLSWESEQKDYPYKTIEDAMGETITQYREEYKNQINSPEIEDYLPIYSIEDNEGRTLIYHLPPILMCNFLGIEWRKVFSELYSRGTMVKSIPDSEFGKLPMFRYCSHCGKPMREGYYIDGDYACTEECAISLYEGDKAQFKADLEADEEHNYGVVYYTEWPDFNLED